MPLKSAYKKLRLLIDLGCIFIGHGLSKDFRIISAYLFTRIFEVTMLNIPSDIAVPKEQVLDTVDIYFLKERQRRIGLRFLSWYLLRQTIQIDTHNSIEDARAALLLYKLYIELEETHQFDETLDEIYREGRKLVRVIFRLCVWVCLSKSRVELENSRRSYISQASESSSSCYDPLYQRNIHSPIWVAQRIRVTWRTFKSNVISSAMETKIDHVTAFVENNNISSLPTTSTHGHCRPPSRQSTTNICDRI